MIFESLWPLFFLIAVPIIIILYLLKPRGEDYEISSNLLWQKLLKNQQSKTFFEKFVHNILMYLQILTVILLVIALMAPFIRMEGKSGGRKILLMDTSAGMQHKGSNGKTRLEESVEQACDYVRTMGNTRFSIITANGCQMELLAVDSADTGNLVRILQGLNCSDSGGSLLQAQSIIDGLAGETVADLLVFTDGSGAEEFEQLRSEAGKSLYVVGDKVSNLANEYTVYSGREDGLYDVLVSVTNYSDSAATCDVGIYEGEKLLTLKSLQLEPSENRVCLLEGLDWPGEQLYSKLSGISFEAGGKDSLERDNLSYVVKTKGDLIEGLLVGEGNTFLEKAYLAVTGTNVAKSSTVGSDAQETYNVVIYDAGQESADMTGNRLIFGDAYGSSTEVLNHVVLDMADCELAAGLSDFYIGVNKAYCFDLPPGAHSFLEYEGKTVGYYLDTEDHREIVVGFDIRESDFPLRAEFPVFLANSLIYLSDTSWLATNVYYAGETLALQPWAEPEEGQVPQVLDRAGCYEIGNEEYKEGYVVRFQTSTESDGRATAESISGESGFELGKVKQALRNLFLVLVLLLLIVEWVLYVRQMRYQGKFYLVIRCLVTVSVILALLGVQLPMGSNRTATIFLVDLSNSNKEHLEEAKAFLSDNIFKMPSGNSYGIVTFGNNTLVEQFVTTEKKNISLMTTPEKSATNFEDAISKAMSLIPENVKGRLVVLTDGKETKGDIHRMAKAVTASQLEVLTLLYEDEQIQDAYIDNVILPAYLHPGDEYSINVLVESNYDTDAVITVFNGSKQVAANQVHLNKGSNHFVFREQVGPDVKGNAMESLRIVVKAEGDGCEENDSYNAFSVIEALPRVLVITDRNTDITGFEAVLQAAGCDFTTLSAFNAPDNIQDMLAYKTIVLVDTYIDDLPYGFLENLETYVKDYGCGFVCCGGEDSFALGGYRDTVIETVLPVDMELRGMNEAPSMAMVMVIDHSGSMMGEVNGQGGTNLDVAIKATTVAVDNLRDKDYVGVLTFDDGYDWQVKLTLADDKSNIKDAVKAIEAGGGTTIKPALQEACRVISQSEASVKHVILLTDGMGETTNYTDVINAYNNSGITLSTVAVGEGSDTKLLENLAEQCGGRYYYSDLSSDIPKIFAREVFLGGDSFIQNGNFALSVRSGHDLTKGLFAEGWPYVYGYVSSSPKAASSSIITSVEKGDPILTVWQYGLGRTVAWNSDVTGEWSGAFAGKEDYVQLWKRITDYSAGNANMGEDRVNVVTAAEVTEILYEAKDYTTDTEILATVIGPEGESNEVKLFATAPGKYKAELLTSQVGMYHFNIRREEQGEIAGYMTTAAAVQFSDEYKYDVDTSSYISFIEKYGGVITDTDYLWKEITATTRGKRPLANLLIASAILLFLADVAMRRFQYVPRWKVRKTKVETPVLEKEQTVVSAAEPVAEVKQKEQAGKSKEKPTKTKKKETSQSLDTSSLLKKKEDRNI